ncbi:hypothetical protein ACYQR9_15605 [Methylobacterium sp. CM6241]
MTIVMAPRPEIDRGATQAALDAARDVVRHRRWYLDLADDRPLPDAMQAALERALVALDAAEAEHGRG